MSGDLPEGAAVVVLGKSAASLGRRVAAHLPEARLHARRGPRHRGGCAISAKLVPHLAALFAEGAPIVGICAAGILIRALAPLLAHKREEPPVVAVAEDGSAAVPLLGGHRGANSLAREISRLLGGQPRSRRRAISCSAWHSMSCRPAGAPPIRKNPRTSPPRCIAGEPVALAVEAGNADWLMAARIPLAPDAPRLIRITDRVPSPAERALVLHPPVLALGVGCARDCAPDELLALARDNARRARARRRSGRVLSPRSISRWTSRRCKISPPRSAFRRGSSRRPACATRRRDSQTPSDAVFRAVGCYGVAEGAALAAVGPDGVLVAPKRVTRCMRPAPSRARRHRSIRTAIGRARGHLAIVGIGPGDRPGAPRKRKRRSPHRRDIVGLQLYLDLLGRGDRTASRSMRAPWATRRGASSARSTLPPRGATSPRLIGRCRHLWPREPRLRAADREPSEDWRRVEISVVPGVSALQAAAARLGAPFGHDFCAISLSDLLTPWQAIERRLDAAASGDFVVALYNPRSARRPGAA